MLQVKTPEDIKQYKDKWLFGLTTKQVVVLTISVIISLIVWFISHKPILVMYVSIIIGLIGFTDIDNYLKPVLIFLFSSPKYYYIRQVDEFIYGGNENVHKETEDKEKAN